MPWPKGVKRVGYIRRDGQPHNKKGEGRAADKGARITIVTKPDPTLKTTIRRDVDPDRIEKAQVATTTQSVVGLKGATGRPVVEPCPSCGFAYADGAFCPECGWTRYDPTCPHCKRAANRG